MYGAIYGDLAGSIYEYSEIKKITSINPDTLITNDSFYSDDTILTIAILDAILHDRNYDKYIRQYINKYKDYKPNFNPYFNTSFSPNLIKWSNDNVMGKSTGNGAIMRISPIGFMFDKEEDVIMNAVYATIPSHNSEEAINAAVTLSLMIYYFRRGYNKKEVYNKLNINVSYKPFSKFNTTCKETLGNCLYSFYKSKDFEDSIRKTLLMGGDTDTNCAIVGSLSEAFYGMDDGLKKEVEDKIPNEFVKVLKMKQ